jgi:hypothetical protein
VPEHRIRLRGGWELQDLDAGGAASPLALPVTWGSQPFPRRLRLVRRFGRPKSGRVRLVLEDVEGLRSAELNGEPLAIDVSSPGRIDVDLPPLDERNTLALEVVVGESPGRPATPWGIVALSIDEEPDDATRPGD